MELSPVDFKYDLGEIVFRPTTGTFWNAFLVVGKLMVLAILVMIMFALVFLNCSRIRLLYDRKRTHYFYPFYTDPQVGNRVRPYHVAISLYIPETTEKVGEERSLSDAQNDLNAERNCCGAHCNLEKAQPDTCAM
uniref:CX domain-containing protein n=1 Tax=Angiostrongylus cantonensis TaxID=6313 RepID=A0A0K0CUP3_ANGCA